jgi:hypothetical protein
MYCGYFLSQVMERKDGAVVKGFCYILLWSNIPMIIYFSRFHQVAPIAVMDYLRVS